MPGRGPQTFKKRQKEQERKERQQEKMAKRLQRKTEEKTPFGEIGEPSTAELDLDMDDDDILGRKDRDVPSPS